MFSKIKFFALTFFALATGCLTHSSIFAQPRDAGKLVVPKGYENYDSVRFSMWGLEFARIWHTKLRGFDPRFPDAAAKLLANGMGDSLYATFEGEFCPLFGGTGVIGGKLKGTGVGMNDEVPTVYHLSDIMRYTKARTFYPSPSGPEMFHFNTAGCYWRYNDVNFNPAAKWYNNSYDANDISPYCEYPANDSFVRMRYATKTYTGTDTVYTGDNGRVVLGYSDERNARLLLHVQPNYFFRDSTRGGGGAFLDSSRARPDTAKNFSMLLDFNIDDSSIDTSFSAGRSTNNLPLAIVQVLFKRGSSVVPFYAGQPVLPFTPFRDATHTSDTLGWYKVSEVVITDSLYKTLDTSWKCEDTLQSGAASHAWKFKQLHFMFNDIPDGMRSTFFVNRQDSDFNHWGQGTGAGRLQTFATSDSVVGLDHLFDSLNSSQELPYLEFRVLSTYRATIRVRGLDYHDTIIDKYLYRKRIAGTLDSTHSCNPDGSIGGYDDSVSAEIVAHFGATSPIPLESMFYDYGPTEGGGNGALSSPMMGYMDFMAGKHNIYTHWHEQDSADNSFQYRRYRMIFNGEPPCMFENEQSFYSTVFPPYNRVFPGEYLNRGGMEPQTTTWPAPLDSLVGLITCRKTNANPYAGYLEYEREQSFFSQFCQQFRSSSRVALWHPNRKRFTIEGGIQGWGLTHYPIGTYDSAHGRWSSYDTATGTYKFHRKGGYDREQGQRATTPEETLANGFCLLAEGIGTICSPQAINDALWGYAGGTGAYGPAPRTHDGIDTIKFVHSYNIGHEYCLVDPHRTFLYHPDSLTSVIDTIWDWTNRDSSDICGDLPPFYVGYSNHWRAYRKLAERINMIYDSNSTNGRKCPHPYKYMTWLDAYSNNCTGHEIVSRDSSTKAHAFLKITKTQKVHVWDRGPKGEYIDSVDVSDNLHFDSLQKSLVEVGLFKDSISTTNINRAAFILNTRTYPSLRDSEDVHYYNDGLDTLSQCHPIFGDIDVRKIYMTIDTLQLNTAFRSPYYVVRDLWHPDTTWLVKCDSEFAVYIKPGDAKFLYFEKAISIVAAVGSTITDSEFCFNNGHRVAERMSRSRDVITYTRNHHVYVSYPAIGPTFYKSERSSGDNIATGIEVPIDTLHFCARPSIMVARNDTGVAIVYWSVDSDVKAGPSYRIRAAFQPHPDSAWTVAEEISTQLLDDNSHDLVTPVLAPIGDTTWLIAAANNATSSLLTSEIRGFKYYTPRGAPSHFDFKDTVLVALPDAGAKVFFPTCASRPLSDAQYPFRLAYQYRNQIYYTRFRFDSSRFAYHDAIFNVSAGLQGCENLHPCIATNGTRYFYPSGEAGMGTFSNTWIDDDVTWETKDSLRLRVAIGTFWLPVIRHRYQTDAIAGHWGGFDVWNKDGTLLPIHWPEITAQHEQYTVVNPYLLWANKQPLHDWIRATWQADPSGRIWIAGWIPGTWYTATFGELGRFPSLALTTDSIPNWGKDSVVPRSIAFQSYTSKDSKYDVKVTNGWVPWLATAYITPLLWIFLAGDTNCTVLVFNERLGLAEIGSPVRPIVWLPSDQGRGGQFDDDWPATSRAPNELHTNVFAIHGSETITLDRTLSDFDSLAMRSHLSPGSDYVRAVITLRRWADSSYLGTLDSIYISNTVNRSPGYGLSATTATMTVPADITSDSAFLMMEFQRGDTTDGLHRALIELVSDSVNDVESDKRATKAEAPRIASLKLSAHPNPFNPTTWIEVSGTAGLHTQIDLMDVLGKPVQTLYDSDLPESGSLHLILNASQLASGAYFVRARSGSEVQSLRIELVK